LSILTINAGSSSIRFAVYEDLNRQLSGRIERIGIPGTTLVVEGKSIPVPGDPVTFLIKWLEKQTVVSAIGHRIVHGLKHSRPERITAKLLAELHRITPYAPEHLPREIELIEAFRKRHPRLAQVACFDTAFHRTMPPVAKLIPIPRRYQKQGIERYGFHGLSCAHLMEELGRLAPEVAKGRVILAHLGNGSSLTAVKNGESVDTSMAFTPAAGLVMSTRTGDLDPGLLYFLSRSEGITPARFHRMVNHQSGLLGVSGLSSDMRDLLRRESSNRHAAEAVALYCYQAKKWIGSFAAVLGGVDALVFTGGVGENSPVIRDRICEGLEFLDIASKVRVIPADEEIMIARAVRDIN